MPRAIGQAAIMANRAVSFLLRNGKVGAATPWLALGEPQRRRSAVAGTTDKVKGSLEETEGKTDQAKGKAKDAAGDVQESAKGVRDSLKGDDASH
jgi:uncharacterized protein YjbJ (UPF0337 family)